LTVPAASETVPPIAAARPGSAVVSVERVVPVELSDVDPVVDPVSARVVILVSFALLSVDGA